MPDKKAKQKGIIGMLSSEELELLAAAHRLERRTMDYLWSRHAKKWIAPANRGLIGEGLDTYRTALEALSDGPKDSHPA